MQAKKLADKQKKAEEAKAKREAKAAAKSAATPEELKEIKKNFRCWRSKHKDHWLTKKFKQLVATGNNPETRNQPHAIGLPFVASRVCEICCECHSLSGSRLSTLKLSRKGS